MRGKRVGNGKGEKGGIGETKGAKREKKIPGCNAAGNASLPLHKAGREGRSLEGPPVLSPPKPTLSTPQIHFSLGKHPPLPKIKITQQFRQFPQLPPTQNQAVQGCPCWNLPFVSP